MSNWTDEATLEELIKNIKAEAAKAYSKGRENDASALRVIAALANAVLVTAQTTKLPKPGKRKKEP